MRACDALCAASDVAVMLRARGIRRFDDNERSVMRMIHILGAARYFVDTACWFIGYGCCHRHTLRLIDDLLRVRA